MNRLMNCAVAVGVVVSQYGMVGAQTTVVPPKPVPPVRTPVPSVATPVPPVPADDYLRHDQVPWFAAPGVREQLRLSDEQFRQLHRDYAQYWRRYDENLKNLDKKMTPAERRERAKDLSSSFHKEFAQNLDDALTNPEMRRRYDQLYLQYLNYGAFSDPIIQEQLKLSAAQQRKFDQYERDWYRQLNTLRTVYPRNRDQVSKAIDDARLQSLERIDQTLTPDQQDAWHKMIGRRYSFTPDDYYPNRGTFSLVQ